MGVLLIVLAVGAIVSLLVGSTHYRTVAEREGRAAAFLHWFGALNLVVVPVFILLWLMGVVP